MANLNALIAQGAQFDLPNPVDQYSKVMQLQSAQQQMQMNRQQAQQIEEDRAGFAKLRAALAQKNLTPEQYRLALIDSPDPKMQQMGVELGIRQTQLDELDKALDGGVKPPMAAMPAEVPMAAPAVAPIAEKTAPLNIQEVGDYRIDRNISLRNQAKLINIAGKEPLKIGPNEYFGENIGGGLEIKTLPTVANALAAQVAPAAPVANAMLAQPAAAAPVGNAMAAKQAQIAEINRKLDVLNSPRYSDLTGVKGQIDTLERQLKQLTESPFAKESRSNFTPASLAKFDQSGNPADLLPVDKEGTKSELARLIAERAQAVTSGASPQILASYDAAIKKATTPAQGTTVNVNAGEKAEEVAFRQLLVKQYEEVSARANVAAKSIPNLEINLKILDKGFDTGFGTETIAAGAKVLAALGVQNAKDFATDAQTFLANANSAVLQKQLEQKGVQTAADADRITSTGAQLGNTKEANKFILSVAKAQLQRDVAQRKFYSDWREENKTFSGAEDAWYAGPGGASLFDSPILKKYIEPSGAALIPGSKPAATGGNVVTLPDGRTKTFPTAEAANQFKKAAGL